MAKNPIVFAMANPEPEILPHLAKQAGAMVVGTGRSDYPNQVNNVLAFPGIFKGALSVRARAITENMKLSAAYALASLVTKQRRGQNFVIFQLQQTDVTNRKLELLKLRFHFLMLKLGVM